MNIIHILLFKVVMIILNLHRPSFLTGEKILHKITRYQLHFLSKGFAAIIIFKKLF